MSTFKNFDKWDDNKCQIKADFFTIEEMVLIFFSVFVNCSLDLHQMHALQIGRNNSRIQVKLRYIVKLRYKGIVVVLSRSYC